MSNRPVVLLDLDGPVADFDAAFFAMCDREGWPVDCTPETQTHRFATDHLPDRRQRRLARAVIDGPGWFESLPVTPGAAGGLWTLSLNAEVWLCTKPLASSTTCRDEKARWVADHFDSDWVERLIITPNKALIRGDVLLDDAPYLEWIGQATWEPVIYPTPWNGAGSKWATPRRWKWGDPIDQLLPSTVPG